MSRISLFGMKIDALNLGDAVEQVLGWTQVAAECRYVVTPNVDHAVMFQEHAGLRDAYAEASLVLADGAPVVAAARMLNRPLPERVAGSDLVPALFEEAHQRAVAGRLPPLRVYLLGAGAGVAETAARRMQSLWPTIQVVGTYSPPLGFEHDPAENQQILSRIVDARPQLLLVGLGAPKQELWIHRHRQALQVPAALCIGATIDFLAGEKSRAPAWMRGIGLEWLHRLSSEPGRLARRYARDAVIFPTLVWQEWRKQRGAPPVPAPADS